MKNHWYKKSLLSAALLTMSSITFAHQAGETIIRAGFAQANPDSSSSEVLGVTDSSVSVGNNAQLGLTATYMLSDNLGIGVLGATPFQHSIKASGSIASFGKIGSTRHLPPTFTAQYFFNDKNAAFNPYVGLGFNYTTFFSTKTTQNLDNAVAAVTSLTVTSTKMSLKDSFGVAFEAGFDYQFNDKWMLNAAVWKVNMDTTANVDVNAGATSTQIKVHIDPVVYMVGIGYRF